MGLIRDPNRTARGGGEPVDFARTLLSHGVAELAPNVVAPDGAELTTVLPAAGKAWPVRVVADGPTRALVECPDAAPSDALVAQIRHMLRLDDDLSAFYARAAEDPELAWAAQGAGGWLRSPTVFEDLVKTICTTNCTWSATLRMVNALVGELGAKAGDGRRAFPTPDAMAEAPDDSTPRPPRPATAARTCAASPPTSRTATSTSKRSPTRRCPTTTWPSGCSRSRASGRTPRRT